MHCTWSSLAKEHPSFLWQFNADHFVYYHFIIHRWTQLIPYSHYNDHNVIHLPGYNADYHSLHPTHYIDPPSVCLLLHSHIAESFHINFPRGVCVSLCIWMGVTWPSDEYEKAFISEHLDAEESHIDFSFHQDGCAGQGGNLGLVWRLIWLLSLKTMLKWARVKQQRSKE